MSNTKVFVGIGSNLGEKARHCRAAVERMDAVPGCRVEAVSPFFRTEPVGVDGQDWYVNAVAQLDVGIPARELLQALLAIESEMGRVRLRKWDSRPIDLDILIYGGAVIDQPDLKVPHPLMHVRRFVMVPLVSLAPKLVHPVLGQTMETLLEMLPLEEQAVAALGD